MPSNYTPRRLRKPRTKRFFEVRKFLKRNGHHWELWEMLEAPWWCYWRTTREKISAHATEDAALKAMRKRIRPQYVEVATYSDAGFECRGGWA